MSTAAEKAQIAAIRRELSGVIDRQVRRISLDLHGNLVEATPVDTGRARAGWVERKGRGPGSREIGNSVPYIVPLNSGSSSQEPSGLVERAIADAVARARARSTGAGGGRR